MPFLGAAIALLLNLATAKIFDYDFIDYLKITFLLTVIFSVPFIIKSLYARVPQRFGRKLSVIFAVLVFSFTITFPVNFLLTFGKSEHETIVITDKDKVIIDDLSDIYVIQNEGKIFIGKRENLDEIKELKSLIDK